MNLTEPSPVAGQDYPQTWIQFLDWFGTEESCVRYLERIRWREEFVCPACGRQEEPYQASRRRLVCRACHHQASVTAGTIFDKTRTPLKVWFAAAWYVTNQKQGVSALGLQRVLGLGSYQTAWAMLHRFRRAMVRPGRESLHGIVEVDESYLALTERGQPVSPAGRQSRTTQALIAIAVEILDPKGFGRIRLRRIPAASETYLLPFVTEAVCSESVVRTDGSAAYRNLPDHGYTHERRVMLGSTEPAHVSMPGVHRVAALIQRWLLGTHHGAVQPSQLDRYLDEFAFRFNRRTSRSRGLLFYRLMEQAVAYDPIPYVMLTKKRSHVKTTRLPRSTTHETLSNQGVAEA